MHHGSSESGPLQAVHATNCLLAQGFAANSLGFWVYDDKLFQLHRCAVPKLADLQGLRTRAPHHGELSTTLRGVRFGGPPKQHSRWACPFSSHPTSHTRSARTTLLHGSPPPLLPNASKLVALPQQRHIAARRRERVHHRPHVLLHRLRHQPIVHLKPLHQRQRL